MTHILGISGSLRRGSFNTALLRAAVGLMPSGATLEVRKPGWNSSVTAAPPTTGRRSSTITRRPAAAR